MAITLKSIMPAVVNITATHPVSNNNMGHNQDHRSPQLPNDLKPRQGSEGSGVIIDAKKGYIITNGHVIADGIDSITVTLSDGQKLQAKLIGKDSSYDLAVIQIDPKDLINKTLTEVTFANSSKLLVGQTVAAIGSPFGLEQTVTTGIVSALDRTVGELIPNAIFIQTDASINPGNSGGALVNKQGQLIGINTAIISPTNSSNGIGFAIPSNLVKAVSKQLIQYGKIYHGILGVTTQNLNPALREVFNLKSQVGVLVTKVVPGSPADKAGIKREDIIQQVDDNLIRNSKGLQNTIRLIAPKTKVTVTIIREQQQKHADVIIGNANTKFPSKQIRYIHGIRLQDFSQLKPNSQTLTGAIVIGINSNTPANIAGLMRGDVILQANHEKINDINELIKVITKIPKGKPLLIEASRADTSIYMVIQDH